MKKTFEKVCELMSEAPDIDAAIIIGSQARTEVCADEYSDLDIIIVSSNSERYLSTDNWLTAIADFHISFIEDTLFHAKERRVLFDDGTDVDFIILDLEQSAIIKTEGVHNVIFQKGINIIKDKLNITEALSTLKTNNLSCKMDTLQSQTEFSNTVHDFWFHCVWTAKKIMRGELLTAKYCLDSYMKQIVLSFIEQYMILQNNSCNIWYNGRFIESWAASWIVESLTHCYAKYDRADMAESLYATMELFSSLSTKIAKQQEYKNDEMAKLHALKIVDMLFKMNKTWSNHVTQ